MKLIDVRHDDIPDNNNPYNNISIPIGDRLINDVLNGGYNVQPVPCVPLLNSPVTDKIIKIYDNGNIKIDILFTLGLPVPLWFITSLAPLFGTVFLDGPEEVVVLGFDLFYVLAKLLL